MSDTRTIDSIIVSGRHQVGFLGLQLARMERDRSHCEAGAGHVPHGGRPPSLRDKNDKSRQRLPCGIILPYTVTVLPEI
jgi:hypothetical protein